MSSTDRAFVSQVIAALDKVGAKPPAAVTESWQATQRISQQVREMGARPDTIYAAIATALERGDDPALDPEVQRGLLTYFDDRFIRPRGVTPFRSFQHIIAATNRDVREGAYQQWFRNDLLERFTLQLEIPPLRSRGADEIRQLVDFVAQDPDENPVIDGSRLVTHIAAPALEDLVHRSYRNGNFRELTRTVRDGLRAAMARHSRVVELSDLAREEALHVRSDRDLARLDATDVHVPDAVALVTVAREGDLRLLANRINQFCNIRRLPQILIRTRHHRLLRRQ